MAVSSSSSKSDKPNTSAAKSSEEAPERLTNVNPRASVLVDSPEAHTDRVAMVSRDKNGNPDQAAGYEVIVPDDEKDVAENRPSDNQGDGS